MDLVEFWELVESEEAGGKSNDKEVVHSMVSSASDFRVLLHEEMPACNSPAQVRRVWISSFRGVLPSEKSTVLADSVYRFLVVSEPSVDDRLTVACQGGRLKAKFRVQTPYSSCQIFGCGEEETRVARPVNVLDGIEVTGVISVQDEGSEL